MAISRRAFLASTAALLASRRARAATVTDATGRALPVPEKVTRVFPGRTAGRDPALYACARSAARLAARQPSGRVRLYAAGRLHPAGSRPHHRARQYRKSRNVLALKPDLILDVGSTSATFVSLAERVQEQTGIPYALLDGRFDAHRRRPIASSASSSAGRADAEKLARYAEDTLNDNHSSRIAAVARRAAAARLLCARAARARDRPRRLDQRRDNRAARPQRRGRNARAASPMSRSSRCCCGIPM